MNWLVNLQYTKEVNETGKGLRETQVLVLLIHMMQRLNQANGYVSFQVFYSN